MKSPGFDSTRFAENMARIAEHSQQLLHTFANRHIQPVDDNVGMSDMQHIREAFADLFAAWAKEPDRLLNAQWDLCKRYGDLWLHTLERFWDKDSKPVASHSTKDTRFRDEAWQESIVFNFIKQSYLLTAGWMQDTVKQTGELDKHTLEKVQFFTRQYIDALAPSNFVMTNPEVLRTTLESNGENLLAGLQTLLHDLEHGAEGEPCVPMTQLDAFTLGENLATTPGKVVYENELMQLIQYDPMTPNVFQRPLLIIPAWINKYYILDLQKKNSLIRWLIEQGHTVFTISWVNPDKKLADKSFEDYLRLGPIAALDAIERATGESEISAIGYCLGGTLLAITLAWLKARGKSPIISATFLTTMLDFSDCGELSIFIDEEQLNSLESRIQEQGFLKGSDMAMTFSLLRANDLIWSFVVNSYLLGREAMPFDMLYWNADSTNMPARMHMYYLRNMYQHNRLVKGKLELAGETIDLTSIDTPAYFLSTSEDHIAPWKSTYAACGIFKGPIRFVLAGSGHIAGVINHPDKRKYGFQTNPENPNDPSRWLASAKPQEGSWWPDWQAWQEDHAGSRIAARQPGDHKLPVIEGSPGRYVRVQTSPLMRKPVPPQPKNPKPSRSNHTKQKVTESA